jgi:hypothetical protein
VAGNQQAVRRKRCRQFLRKDGFRFFFFSREGTEPPHIQVEQPAVLLEESRGFHSSDLLRIHNLIEENREVFRLKCDEHFSQ